MLERVDESDICCAHVASIVPTLDSVVQGDEQALKQTPSLGFVANSGAVVGRLGHANLLAGDRARRRVVGQTNSS